MRASAYLRSPSVFGFHGVYKPIAIHTRILDQDSRLLERGRELLQAWWSDHAERGGSQMLADAIKDALKAGHTTRTATWKGWDWLGRHLAPAGIGTREADCLRNLMLDSKEESRAEVFQLMWNRGAAASTESTRNPDRF